jgi:hypothetical protein
MPTFRSNLDLQKNQLLNPVLQNLSNTPSNPVEGQMFYDAGKKTAFIWNGTSWLVLGQGQPSPQIKQFQFHIQSPLRGYGALMVRLYQNLTVVRVDSHISSGTSLSFHVESRSSVNSNGVNITSSPMVAVNAGTAITSFSNANVPADNWLFLNITDLSGTIGLLTITITCLTN